MIGQGAMNPFPLFMNRPEAAILVGAKDVVAILAGQFGLIHGLVGLA